MRLICPNCDAQYEVDDGAIPEAGRDVQCSNCGHAWFQQREVVAADLSDELYREPEAVAPVPAAVAQTDADDEEEEPEQAPPPPAAVAAAAPVQRKLDEDVLAILREEAERELAARRAEANAIEMQGDLGLPPPVSPVVGSAAAAAAASAAARSEAVRRPGAEVGGANPALRPAARRDLLPDIEEINSSLRPNDMAASLVDEAKPRPVGKSSGFRTGFALMLILAALALAVYVMAPQISAQIPGAADAMQAYVAAVDSLRVAVDGLMKRATGALNGLTGG
ncbi:zinc-ribbon domain-containing protein [Pseudotabrizicola algicola]|uniref:Thioredoxin n=1 Tax=Pseudotabrizicola algicola TaxID=2709381 RepID=A0A6B3RT26_9RHOB|nr:zinc-ribbon domain-containing protein [Pseudotabrizicola algicola]NEX46202.1 thioredoxin [Pseudotabrizicola algicola]